MTCRKEKREMEIGEVKSLKNLEKGNTKTGRIESDTRTQKKRNRSREEKIA